MKSAPASQLPERPSGSPTVAIAPTHDSLPDVLLDAADGHHGFVGNDTSLVVGADHQAAEIRAAGAAVDLGAGDDRHLLALDEPDAAAEVRHDVLVQAEAEREDVVAFEEERALLGKNSGKRVRFVRRVSTSVSAKSVLTVSEATTFAPSRCVTSRLGWNSPSTSASTAPGRRRRS